MVEWFLFNCIIFVYIKLFKSLIFYRYNYSFTHFQQIVTLTKKKI